MQTKDPIPEDFPRSYGYLLKEDAKLLNPCSGGASPGLVKAVVELSW